MFHSADRFDFAAALHAQWAAIARECAALERTPGDLHHAGTTEELAAALRGRASTWIPSWQTASRERNDDWLLFPLAHGGQLRGDVEERLPRTSAALRSLPGMRVAAFSLLRPTTVIGRHRHPELGGTLLTLHLGLTGAEAQNYLNVDGRFEEERPGKLLVFDGSYEHFALNASPGERVVLYVEFDAARSG